MAKKVRFPLEMENGTVVRSLEELRENFSLARVLTYVKNGKLAIWLRDRYANSLADAIEHLDVEDANLPEKICEILGVPYDERAADGLEDSVERNCRLEKLKTFTMEERFLAAVDDVAFGQDDLYDLLDEGKTVIYLCGDKFSIPLEKKGIAYIGVNAPMAVIDAKEIVDWKEKKITLEGIRYDEKYQRLLDAEEEKKDRYQLVIAKNYVLFGTMLFGAFLIDKKDSEIISLLKKAEGVKYEKDKLVILDVEEDKCSEVEINKAGIIQIAVDAISIKSNGDKVYSVIRIGETKEGELHIFDIRSLRENVFADKIKLRPEKGNSFGIGFSFQDYGKILACSEKWVVYEGYDNEYSICDLCSGTIKYCTFTHNMRTYYGVIVEDDLYCYRIIYRDSDKIRKIVKLSLKNLESTADIISASQNKDFGRLEGSLMKNGRQLLFFWENPHSHISLYQMDCANGQFTVVKGIVEKVEAEKAGGMSGIHGGCSIYKDGKIYFISYGGRGYAQMLFCCMDLATERIQVLRRVDASVVSSISELGEPSSFTTEIQGNCWHSYLRGRTVKIEI